MIETHGPDESTLKLPDGGETDRERATKRRAQYLEATTILDRPTAHALALKEQGFSNHSIADRTDSTKSTIDDRMGRVIARYGLSAAATKRKDDRGDLGPVTREQVAAAHPENRRRWVDAATAHPQYAPDWFDPRTYDHAGDPDDGDGENGGGRL